MQPELLQLNRPRIFGLLTIGLILILDQLSKNWILYGLNLPACPVKGLPPRDCGARSIDVLPFFDLTMVWNSGISFGLFKGESWIGVAVLSLLSLAVASGFFIWIWRSATPFLAIALGLVVGGALGNIFDRIAYGAVVDFLDFTDLYFPWVFNVADASINIGVVLLAWHLLFQSDEKSA